MTQNNLTEEQLTYAVARVLELDAKCDLICSLIVPSDIRKMQQIIRQLWAERAELKSESLKYARLAGEHRTQTEQQRAVMQQAREALWFIQALGLEPHDLPDNIRIGRAASCATKALAALDAALGREEPPMRWPSDFEGKH